VRQTIEFHAPNTVAEACALLAERGDTAKVVAGGVAVVNLLRLRFITPEHLVSLHRIGELRYIRYDETRGLVLGALTTHREVERSELVRRHVPMLCELAASIAGVQIRNRGSVGGSLVHADPRGDLAPGLIALRASVVLRSRDAERALPIEELLVDYYETALHPDELLSEVRVAPTAPRTGASFFKYWSRTPSDFAVMNAACVVTVADGRCADISIGLGGVHRRAFRPRDAEAALKNGALGAADLERAASIAATECEPIGDLKGSAEYKREMVRKLLPRVITEAAQRARRER
jgi:carbon-monoxide dehydrogenase medium subunit